LIIFYLLSNLVHFYSGFYSWKILLAVIITDIISLLSIYNNYAYFLFSKYVCQAHVVWLQFGQRGCDSCCVHVVTTVWCRCRAAKSSEWRARHHTLNRPAETRRSFPIPFAPSSLNWVSLCPPRPYSPYTHPPTSFYHASYSYFFVGKTFRPWVVSSPTTMKKTTTILNIILLFL